MAGVVAPAAAVAAVGATAAVGVGPAAAAAAAAVGMDLLFDGGAWRGATCGQRHRRCLPMPGDTRRERGATLAPGAVPAGVTAAAAAMRAAAAVTAASSRAPSALSPPAPSRTALACYTPSLNVASCLGRRSPPPPPAFWPSHRRLLSSAAWGRSTMGAGCWRRWGGGCC